MRKKSAVSREEVDPTGKLLGLKLESSTVQRFIERQRGGGKAAGRAPESGGGTSGEMDISATDIGAARLRRGR